MVELTEVQKRLIAEVADLHKVPIGAYNFRANSSLAGRNTTANIDIQSKPDGSGIDIRIKPGTKNESVHIPVVISETGIKETVYNDFYIGEGADVTIVAGCGIDNCGGQDSQHDARTPSTTVYTAFSLKKVRRLNTLRSTTAQATGWESAYSIP